MNERRGHWYLLTGLLIGFVLGLVFAWVVQPVEYVDTAPASLRADFKDQYRVLIASAYVTNGDLVRAKARLELLADNDVFRLLAEQAQRTLAQNGSAAEARALGLLAIALGQEAPGPAIALTQVQESPAASATHATPIQTALAATATMTLLPVFTPTLTPIPTQAEPTATLGNTATQAISGTSGATPIPRPTDTPIPTRTFTPTPGGPFVLLGREKVCTQALDKPLFQIEATNAFGQPVPGVLVIVTWQSGEERFFTGLKLEKGLGYADFTPIPGIVYAIRLGEGGQPALDLTSAECKTSTNQVFWGIWLLKFVQP